MRVLTAVLIVLKLACVACAADPVKPIPRVASSIVVSKGVTGDGKRLTPFEFDASTKCVISLPDDSKSAKDLEWDLEDGPADAEVMGDGRIVAFSQANPGLYLVTARWNGGWAKAWLRVKGPNGPPGPNPPDPDKPSIGQRVADALVGPTAKADAAKLAAICDQIGEELAGKRINETGELFDAWEAAFSGDNKLAGKYPDLAKVLRAALPPPGDGTEISDTDRTRFIRTFQDISKAAKAVAQ